MLELQLKRNYKDSLFHMIFNNKENIRELYHALEDTNFDEDVPIVIETLENALLVDIANDLAFQIGSRYVVLIEHQSYLCSNMPYRMLGYMAKTFERIYKDVNFFSTKKQFVMAPEFYVLYNGTEELPGESTIRLSDCYIGGSSENSLDIVVKILDVSYNKDKKIKSCWACMDWRRRIWHSENLIMKSLSSKSNRIISARRTNGLEARRTKGQSCRPDGDIPRTGNLPRRYSGKGDGEDGFVRIRGAAIYECVLERVNKSKADRTPS